MRNNVNKILGTILMLTSGIIYTAERIVGMLSTAIVASANPSNSHGATYQFYPQFFGNFFVWFFLLTGFVLLVYGYPKNKE